MLNKVDEPVPEREPVDPNQEVGGYVQQEIPNHPPLTGLDRILFFFKTLDRCIQTESDCPHSKPPRRLCILRLCLKVKVGFDGRPRKTKKICPTDSCISRQVPTRGIVLPQLRGCVFVVVKAKAATALPAESELQDAASLPNLHDEPDQGAVDCRDARQLHC
eukprot:3442955-Amphidinium_carterae.2